MSGFSCPVSCLVSKQNNQLNPPTRKPSFPYEYLFLTMCTSLFWFSCLNTHTNSRLSRLVKFVCNEESRRRAWEIIQIDKTQIILNEEVGREHWLMLLLLLRKKQSCRFAGSSTYSNVDLSSRYFEFLPESNRPRRDGQSFTLTNYAIALSLGHIWARLLEFSAQSLIGSTGTRPRLLADKKKLRATPKIEKKGRKNEEKLQSERWGCVYIWNGDKERKLAPTAHTVKVITVHFHSVGCLQPTPSSEWFLKGPHLLSPFHRVIPQNPHLILPFHSVKCSWSTPSPSGLPPSPQRQSLYSVSLRTAAFRFRCLDAF